MELEKKKEVTRLVQEEKRVFAEAEAFGITQKSTEFVHKHLDELGTITVIEGFLAGEHFDEPGNDQWVEFVDDRGSLIIVNGFSWGYGGEGPNGLAKMAAELGFTEFTLQRIAGLPQNEGFRVHASKGGA